MAVLHVEQKQSHKVSNKELSTVFVYLPPKGTAMRTLTVHINERTKAGKTLLAVLEFFSKEKKGVEIIESKKEEKGYPVSKNIPNAETLKAFKENDQQGTKKLKRFDTVDALFEDLGV